MFSISSFIAKWFNKSSVPAPVTFGTLKTRYQCLVEMDLVEFLTHDDYLIFNSPTAGNLHVHGIGTTTLMGTSVVRHYLTDSSGNDNFWLQEIISNENQLAEIFLFSQVDELLPQSSDQWTEFLAQLRSTDTTRPFVLNDVEYYPVWTYPIEHEELIDPRKVDSPVAGGIKYVASDEGKTILETRLYSRVYQYADEEQTQPLIEFLLVSVEDTSIVRMYAGICINPACVQIF